MTYWRLHYHLIWATQDRQPRLIGECEKMFYAVLSRKARELNVKIHAAGNAADHIHLVVSIPPSVTIAECVQQIKGASAFAINTISTQKEKFSWQAGYGALTIGERSLETVKQYATRQKEHHQNQTILPAYETIEETPPAR